MTRVFLDMNVVSRHPVLRILVALAVVVAVVVRASARDVFGERFTLMLLYFDTVTIESTSAFEPVHACPPGLWRESPQE